MAVDVLLLVAAAMVHFQVSESHPQQRSHLAGMSADGMVVLVLANGGDRLFKYTR